MSAACSRHPTVKRAEGGTDGARETRLRLHVSTMMLEMEVKPRGVRVCVCARCLSLRYMHAQRGSGVLVARPYLDSVRRHFLRV